MLFNSPEDVLGILNLHDISFVVIVDSEWSSLGNFVPVQYFVDKVCCNKSCSLTVVRLFVFEFMHSYNHFLPDDYGRAAHSSVCIYFIKESFLI